MADREKKGFWRAFLDFLMLFGGISTSSNLERTQGRAPRTRGLFLMRSRTAETGKQPAERK